MNEDLLSQIRELIGREWNVRIMHIFREANTVADKLARLSRDAPMLVCHYLEPPPGVQPLLHDDRIGRKATRYVMD